MIYSSKNFLLLVSSSWQLGHYWSWSTRVTNGKKKNGSYHNNWWIVLPGSCRQTESLWGTWYRSAVKFPARTILVWVTEWFQFGKHQDVSNWSIRQMHLDGFPPAAYSLSNPFQCDEKNQLHGKSVTIRIICETSLMYYSQCSDLWSIESKKLYRSQSVNIDGTV